jgi:hypothetical protein
MKKWPSLFAIAVLSGLLIAVGSSDYARGQGNALKAVNSLKFIYPRGSGDNLERFASSPGVPDDEEACQGSTTGTTHVGPDKLYPDPNKTPGCAATLSTSDLKRRYTETCPDNKPSCTYSQSHRNVPKGVHDLIYDEYNVPDGERNIQHGEVDHFYPLCAGGSNSKKNLWYQPKDNEWNGHNFGFREKDRLESYICAQIKDGKLLPKVAYNRITSDWVKFYLDEGLNQDGDEDE